MRSLADIESMKITVEKRLENIYVKLREPATGLNLLDSHTATLCKLHVPMYKAELYVFCWILDNIPGEYKLKSRLDIIDKLLVLYRAKQQKVDRPPIDIDKSNQVAEKAWYLYGESVSLSWALGKDSLLWRASNY